MSASISRKQAVTALCIIRQADVEDEQAKINETREGGNLYVLDSGNVPEKKYKPKRAFVVLGWMFISFVLLYMYILAMEWLRALQNRDPERYHYVSAVLDGLKPKRFFNMKDRSHIPGDGGR